MSDTLNAADTQTQQQPSQQVAEVADLDFFSDTPLCPMRPADAGDDYICEACQ